MATKKTQDEKNPVPRAAPRPIRLADAATGRDVAALAPHERARLGPQTLPDGTRLNAGGIPRDKPFPTALEVSKGQGRLD
jgi:hypothetical protein